MKIVYLHPTKGTNIGDNLTFLGTKYLITSAFGPHEEVIAELGPIELNPQLLHQYDDLQADIFVVSGTPWLWDQCENSNKYKVLRYFVDKFKGKVKIALGIGSCYPIGSNTIKEFITHKERSNFRTCMRDTWGQFNVVITRDVLAARTFTELGIECLDTLCTSIHSLGYFKDIINRQRVLSTKPLLVFYNPAHGVSKSSCDKYFIKDYLEYQYQYIEKYNPEIITICPLDEQDLHAQGIQNVTWIKSAEQLVDKLLNHKLIVSGRIHSAIPAQALGISTYILPIDSRYLTAVRVGVRPIFTLGNSQREFSTIGTPKAVLEERRLESEKLIFKYIKGGSLMDVTQYTNRGEAFLIRDEVLKFIKKDMNGLDIGSGGAPIIPQAISMNFVTGHFTDNVQLRGNAKNLEWFKDGCLDYVFSSHCFEDFLPEEKTSVFREWVRVLKKGGKLLLYLPDEQTYRNYCALVGSQRNLDHTDSTFSLNTLRRLVQDNCKDIVKEVYTIEHHATYSFFVVYEKI